MATFEINIKWCWVDVIEFGFGWTMFICFAREFHSPVGFVWGVISTTQDDRNTFDVSGSYVIPSARRNGVRTFINQEILKRASVITTNYGSKEGGEVFLRAFGYQYDEETGTWYYVPPSTSGSKKKLPAKMRGRR